MSSGRGEGTAGARSAVVVPYRHGRAVVRVTEGATLVEQREFEVGRIVCVDHGATRCPLCLEAQGPAGRSGRNPGAYKFRREIDPADVAGVVEAVTELLRRWGVERVTVEEPPQGGGVEAERARWVAGELRAGLPCDVGPAVKDEGPGGLPAAEPLPAGALNAPLPPLQAPVGANPSPPSGTPAPLVQGTMAKPEEGTLPIPEPQGPRTAGIDPGSHWIAVTVIEERPGKPAFIASRTFDVGRLVERRAPKIIKRRDGSTQTSTHHRVIEDRDVEAALESIALFLTECGVGRAVVERATFFHSGDGAPANVVASRAANLLRAQWIGGEIAGALRSVGMPVETCSSAIWRGHAKQIAVRYQTAGAMALMKQALGTAEPHRATVERIAKGATWLQALHGTINDLPATLGEHGFDAAGAALWGARSRESASAEAEPKPRRAPGAPRDRSRAREARAVASAARKAAAGCPCPPPGRLHPDPKCPVGIAANAARSEKMKGNTNARRAA